LLILIGYFPPKPVQVTPDAVAVAAAAAGLTINPSVLVGYETTSMLTVVSLEVALIKFCTVSKLLTVLSLDVALILRFS
jgi:hypothetical protein